MITTPVAARVVVSYKGVRLTAPVAAQVAEHECVDLNSSPRPSHLHCIYRIKRPRILYAL
jgi:hypothetical protein